MKILEEMYVKNFKSIRELKLECGDINIFIGKPNVGKSNILEVLGLLSFIYHSQVNSNLEDYIRHEDLSDIFYDGNVENTIVIELRMASYPVVSLKVKYDLKDAAIKAYVENSVVFSYSPKTTPSVVYRSNRLGDIFKRFKFYRFKNVDKFVLEPKDELLPPDGINLLGILHRKGIRDLIQNILEPFGLKMNIRAHEGKLEIAKLTDGVVISHPYILLSETLRRIIFHLSAVETNKGSIIVFEEPEAHAFPYYTKYISEVIAHDNENQYFISTHNPYFLIPLLEKSEEDVHVFVTYMENYETKVKQLSRDKITEIVEEEKDIFF